MDSTIAMRDPWCALSAGVVGGSGGEHGHGGDFLLIRVFKKQQKVTT